LGKKKREGNGGVSGGVKEARKGGYRDFASRRQEHTPFEPGERRPRREAATRVWWGEGKRPLAGREKRIAKFRVVDYLGVMTRYGGKSLGRGGFVLWGGEKQGLRGKKKDQETKMQVKRGKPQSVSRDKRGGAKARGEMKRTKPLGGGPKKKKSRGATGINTSGEALGLMGGKKKNQKRGKNIGKRRRKVFIPLPEKKTRRKILRLLGKKG